MRAHTKQYIGESGRALGDMGNEHLRGPSPIHQHSNTTGHPVSPDCFTIVHRKSQVNTRNIKVAMFIWVNDTSLNRNLGRYQLCHIQDHILQDIPALQLKEQPVLPTPFPPSPTRTPSHPLNQYTSTPLTPLFQ